MTQEQVTLVGFLYENWQFIFLYVFKYLADIKSLLNTLHTDNAVQEAEIKNCKQKYEELKIWIQRVEDKIK